MPVYVDDAIWEWRGWRWCHLVADTDEELDRFAGYLGLRPQWLQHRPGRPWLDHYDLPEHGRRAALEHGAIAVGRAEIVALIRSKRDVWRQAAEEPPSGSTRTD